MNGPSSDLMLGARTVRMTRDRSWEEVAENERSSWYLDWLVAEQKRLANLALLQKWVEALPTATILKTDLFEEANGRDELLSGLPASARIIGMDIAPTMVSRAKRRIHSKGAHFLGTDVRQIGLASGSVDVVFSNSTLDHFQSEQEFKTAIRELIRVLRPDGTIVITLDNPDNPLYALLRWLGSRGWIPFHLGYTTTLAGLVAELQNGGIRVTATDYLIHNPRIVSTVIFLGVRRLLGRFADGPIRLMLRAFNWLDKLPTRRYTACFVAAGGKKQGGQANEYSGAR